MTPTDPSTTVIPQTDNPNDRQFTAASQFEREPTARQLAGVLAATTRPREMRHHPVACADHRQGVLAAHRITDLMDRGRRLAGPHLSAGAAARKEPHMKSLPEVDPLDVSPLSRS
jgi:hypothetical protein